MPFHDTRVDLSEVVSDRVEENIRNQGDIDELVVYVDLRDERRRSFDAERFWMEYEHPALIALAQEIAKQPIFQPIAFEPEIAVQSGYMVTDYPGRIPIRRIIEYSVVEQRTRVQYRARIRRIGPREAPNAT